LQLTHTLYAFITVRRLYVSDRLNVCEHRHVKAIPVAEPCVKSETRLVRVWKPKCNNGAAKFGCFTYEQRYVVQLLVRYRYEHFNIR